MAKKKYQHQSFKLTPHNQPVEKVILYVVIAILFGFVVGYLLREQTIQVLGLSSY